MEAMNATDKPTMKTITNNRYAVCEFYKDGTVFPVRMDETLERAEPGKRWQQVGRGQFDDWRVIEMTELAALLAADRVNLKVFTSEAQAEKRAIISKYASA